MSKPYLRYEFTRQSLFNLVWRVPAAQIERELHIQVKTLKATCIDFEIPRPSSRYWALLRIGRDCSNDLLPCDRWSEKQVVSVRVRNPNYCSETEDRNRMRAYVRLKAEAALENNREEFIKNLIDRLERISRLENRVRAYLKTSTEQPLENYQSLVVWVKQWLEKEKAAIAPQAINEELEASGLFDATEVAFDFNDETFGSSYLSDNEHEYLVTRWLVKFEEEEEIIKL